MVIKTWHQLPGPAALPYSIILCSRRRMWKLVQWKYGPLFPSFLFLPFQSNKSCQKCLDDNNGSTYFTCTRRHYNTMFMDKTLLNSGNLVKNWFAIFSWNPCGLLWRLFFSSVACASPKPAGGVVILSHRWLKIVFL